MTRFRKYLIAIFLFTLPAFAVGSQTQAPNQALPVLQVDYAGDTLGEVVSDLRQRSGLDIRLSGALRAERVALSARGDSWADLIKQVFAGRNTVIVHAPEGDIYRVYVLASGESPADLAVTPAEALWYLQSVTDTSALEAYAPARSARL